VAESELTKKYQTSYMTKYGRPSEGFAALAYDGLMIIAAVIKKVGTNSERIKDELYKVKDFPGVTGNTTFDDHGDVIKAIIIKTVKNGRFMRYE
jgi:branched-chain amino acid transport system substrate-binding protein